MLLAGLIVATIAAAPDSLQTADSETGLLAQIMTTVTGRVYNSGGLPVVGADVNVSMYDGATLRSYQSDVSDSFGDYVIIFGGAVGPAWAVGDTILVFAEHGDYSGTNSTTAADLPIQEIDVKLNILIPEFGDLGALVPIAGVFGIFMALFFVRRERKP